MATAAYDRENTRRINLKLNNKTDAEIIKHLEAIKKTEGIQTYLKRLILEDIKRGAKTMTYKIKPEYLDQWGEDATTDTIITEDDLEMITRGWGKKPEDVLDQLIPQE